MPPSRSSTSTSGASTGSTVRSSTRCAAVSAAARAGAVGEVADSVVTGAEPFLVRVGFIARTPRGRAATALAWEHLGLTPPVTGEPLLTPLPLEGGEGRFGG